MPVYNGEKVIGETLRSVLGQNFNNFELIICDDCSRDNTAEIIKSFKDSRIKYFRNKNNLGYSGNMEQCRTRAAGDILYLMAQDDILGQGALLNTYNAFMLSDDIGAVTRPYYWFSRDVKVPVRAKEQLNSQRDEVVKIDDDFQKVLTVFKTLDQFSGLAMRKKFIDLPFHNDIFPCHVYPFISIFKNRPIVFLRDYNVAVRIDSSQTRSLSSIYNKSPIQSWVDMFNNVFYEKKYQKLKIKFINDFVITNYIGLVQIRNYAKYRYLLREIYLLVKYRWQNVFVPAFWFFSVGCMLTPAFILIPLVDWYKNNVNARNLTGIKICN